MAASSIPLFFTKNIYSINYSSIVVTRGIVTHFSIFVIIKAFIILSLTLVNQFSNR